MTPEETAQLVLAAMHSAVDEQGQIAVIVQAIREVYEDAARIVERTVSEGSGNPDWPVANLDDVIAAIRARTLEEV
jgi:hypothetical protein